MQRPYSQASGTVETSALTAKSWAHLGLEPALRQAGPLSPPPGAHQPIISLFLATQLMICWCPHFSLCHNCAAAGAQLAACFPSPIIWFHSLRNKRKWRGALEPPHLIQKLVLCHDIYIPTSILGN